MQNSHCYGLIDDVNSVVSTFAFKLTGYLNRVEEEREERVEELKRRRFVAIKAHLMRDGWEEADCEVDFEGEEAYEMLQKDWDRLVNQPKPLTIRSWESIKLKVTRIAEIYREFRLEAERTYRGMERRLKLGELVTAIDTEEPQIIELAPEHDHSSDQSESLTIPFPNWTRALNLWTLRQIAEEDISGLVAEQRFMSRRGMIVQELRNWQRSLAACLVRKLETRDHFGLGDLLVCRMPFMPGLRRTHPPEPVELSTAFTADSSQYILDNDIRTLLRADSVFEFYDYPTCYYFPEIVAIVRDKLLPPPSYIPARHSEDDRDDIYSTNPMGLHGVGAHRLGRRAARGLLASLGKQNAAYLEMSGYGRRFVCGRCWVKTPMTWIEMVTHYARNVTYNWNFPITCSLRAEGIECKEEHGGFKSNVIGTRNKTRADEQSEFQVTTRPLVRLLSIDELNSLESEPLSTQFTCGVCDQVADLHNGQGLDGKPIPRPKGSREVMIEHLLDVHNVTQDMHQFKLNECTGLDNAGKTTILKRLKGQDVMSTSPTLGFEISTITYGKYLLNIWDVGGQRTLRPYWRNYFEQTDVLVWVVDSGDRLRIEDCREELHTLLQEQRLAGASLLVFANKQDITGSMSDEEIKEALDLPSIRSHHWKIQPCSAVTGENVQAGLEWAVSDVAQRVYWGVIDESRPNATTPVKLSSN
ncbi:GTP-binding protein, partial [Rhizoctonia solani]